MKKDEKLVNEITKNANLIPLECKEHVLDLMKAMVFTKNVLTKNKDQPQPRKTG